MKDPAFLFYSSDFLSGTMLMSDEQLGKYIKLLCLQHQKGHLKEKDMLNICKTYDEDIFSKFKKDEDGNYYNERLDNEVQRRKKYSESRKNNRKKKEKKEEAVVEEENICETYKEDMKNICNSYEKHMGTETTTTTINNNINNNIKEELQKNFIECIGSTNLNAIDECISYLKDLPYEVIKIALIKTSRTNKPNWKYAKTILDDWVKLKINTIEKVEAEEQKFKGNKKQKATSNTNLDIWLKKMQEKEAKKGAIQGVL